ncbi:hypothetical protein [Fulvivirga sediminis]|uniref:Lipocalin-like domain-containing protein n=1 Tax=Fulvivirga sediminis TaxID=2803949 RepID=A0A937JXR4_9BACT|nr:hypothetical protein [Fulvivirga sediminis]MBL3655718.1 hypothetical protein [Fulvivirga sediminis]
MKYSIRYFLFSMTLILSCSTPKEKEEKVDASEPLPLQQTLLGEWRNLTLEVTISDADSDSYLHVPEGKWEEVFQVKPVRTTFNSDSTYTSEYRSLEDSVIMVNTGIWYIEDDSLVYINRGQKFKYQVLLEDDEAIFKGYVDWDGDGEVDDFYNGKQKKQ